MGQLGRINQGNVPHMEAVATPIGSVRRGLFLRKIVSKKALPILTKPCVRHSSTSKELIKSLFHL